MKRLISFTVALVIGIFCCSCVRTPVETSTDSSSESVVDESVINASESVVPSESVSESVLETSETDGQVIGDNITYNNSFDFTNSTGRTIIALYVKTSDIEDFEDTNLIDEPFPDGEVRQFYIEVSPTVYDIRVVYEDNSINDINDIFLGFISQASLTYANDLTYIEYTLTDAGQAALEADQTVASEN
ncbi:MAG: hypothetical protein J6127_02310 [Clostridiales bacterium]|nr:hypothetical protein [Clostridiales bacterium]